MLLVFLFVIYGLLEIDAVNFTRAGRRRYLQSTQNQDNRADQDCTRNNLEYDRIAAFELDDDYVKGTVWPKPFEEHREDVYFHLDSSKFLFKSIGVNSDMLQSAFRRYMKITFPKAVGSVEPGDLIRHLDVNVKVGSTELCPDMDESYHLDVIGPRSLLIANTIWGALRGLETFSQVVHLGPNKRYRAQKTVIMDQPRFKHRGFLIDTSRHYLPVNTINAFLDAMSYSKFNVLHWHIVDDPAFPYLSEAFPELSNVGSRNSFTHVYTPQDVKDIIRYAKDRGIRVIPEFDTPGHTKSWKAISGLLTECGNGKRGPVNPIYSDNYIFLEKFFAEIASVFPDDYIHLGGDEVVFDCWKSNDDITEWMKAHNIKSHKELEGNYLHNLVEMVEKLNKTSIIWQDVHDNGIDLKSEVVYNLWLPEWQAKIKAVTDEGHKAILSSCWYLDYISFGMDWPKYYICDPHDFEGTAEQKKLVIGGTAAIWGEMVDATNILPRSWGRGLAVGERLWSPKTVTNAKDAMQRIWEQRCRYLSRGIPAEPVIASKFCVDEWNHRSESPLFI